MIVPFSLKTKGKNKFVQGRPILKKSYITPIYLLIIVFPKLDPLTATGMAVCVNLGPKCQNLFRLVSDLAEFLAIFFQFFLSLPESRTKLN